MNTISSKSTEKTPSRHITHRTRGHGHGPITRLMSPSDLGRIVKPFVFLDIFDVDQQTGRAFKEMPLHPHSGIATVTVATEGAFHFEDPTSNTEGTLGYGAVEWARAGIGMWHGKELTAANVPRIQGFQLWIALPEKLEHSESKSSYIEAKDMHQIDSAYIIVGQYKGVQSPVPAPEGINYLLVKIRAGEQWTYNPPTKHTIGWLSIAKGSLVTSTKAQIDAGEMVVFEENESPITLTNIGQEDTVFVLGSAIPHPHPLHLGMYSVHTSAKALKIGEQHIADLGEKLRNSVAEHTSAKTIPIFR